MTTPNPFNSEDQTSVPAPDAPSFPQASTPGYDQANAAPGAQQPVYGQPAYGQPAYGQPSFGQPAFGQGAYATPPKQWIVALLLAFFVGTFGIHNFYLGYTTRGIIQLVLAITLIGAPVAAIWAFVEFIMIIMRYGAYGCDAQGRPLE
nr:TM2 domain-containing protein [uncultured Actinomyces sp.]